MPRLDAGVGVLDSAAAARSWNQRWASQGFGWARL